MLERVFGMGIFNPAYGCDPVLFQNLFWFYSHPAVYIMILPAFGILSEIIAVHARKRIFGYKAVAWPSVGIAMIVFLGWGHHMFVSGQSPIVSLFFFITAYGAAVPTAIKMFSWTATLYKLSVHLTTPMLYALQVLILFMLGGLAGIPLAALSTDVHVHNTYFVVAHFHYVMMGGTALAWIGGIYHWWPKMTDKEFNEKWGRIFRGLIFIGFNMTLFVQFVVGTQGIPRRYYDYLPTYHMWNVISTIGSWVLAIGLFGVLFNWIHFLIYRKKETNPNPWQAQTRE